MCQSCGGTCGATPKRERRPLILDIVTTDRAIRVAVGSGKTAPSKS